MLDIQGIKAQINIKHALEIYGLEFSSRNKCKCPFHLEKTPSFSVHTKTNRFICFGCGEKGDIFSFVQKYFSLSWPDAFKKVCSDFGIMQYTLTETKKNKLLERRNEITKLKNTLYSALEEYCSLRYEIMHHPAHPSIGLLYHDQVVLGTTIEYLEQKLQEMEAVK